MGTVALVRWGSVEVVGGGGGRYRWVGQYPRERRYRLRTEEQAANFVKSKIAAQIAQGYRRLRGRMRIHPARR